MKPFSTDNNTWKQKLWNADEIPSKQQLKIADRDVISASWRFLLLNKIRGDPKKEPKDLVVSIDEEKILNDWKNAMNHDIPMIICGTCGERDFMIENEDYIRTSVEKLAFFKVKKESIPTNKWILHARNLKKIGNDVYKFVKEGVNEDDTINVCKKCKSSFAYAFKHNKYPLHTIANYDLGRIPAWLPTLNITEKYSIKITMVVNSIFHFKSLKGRCIKGHAFAVKLSKQDIENSIEYNLPRCDVHNYMQLVIYGTDSMRKTALDLIKNTKLHIRLDRVLFWLHWLKGIGNPHFQKVTFPKNETEKQQKIAKLKECIDKIIDNKISFESGTVNEIAEKNRADVADIENDLDEQLDGDFFRSVFLCDDTESIPAIQRVMKDIKKTMVDENENKIYEKNENDEIEDETEDEEEDFGVPKLTKKLENELYNEYINNNDVFSQAFPHIFPFGLSHSVWGTRGKSGTIPHKLAKHWCMFYDNRIAEEIDLLNLMFDQYRRHKRNKAVAWQIKHGGKREETFIKLCNDSHFDKDISAAIKNPTSKKAKKMKAKIEPLIKIIDRKLPWSVAERGDTLGKLYSLMHFFGIATHFITISPHMANHVLAIRLACTDQNGVQKILKDFPLRSKVIEKNPVAATRIFYRLINKFFKIIVGLPLDHFTGNAANISRLLNEKEFSGVFGFITAAFGIVEEQTNGNLHFHGLLFGGWDFDVIQRHIHKPGIAEEIIKLIDSQITCEIPADIKSKDPIKPKPIFAAQPYPDAKDIKNEGALIAMCLQCHKEHKFTCWKKNAPKCRMDMPQEQANKSFFTEIHCDPITKVASRKFENSKPGHEIISEFIEPENEENPFDFPDKRKIVFGHKRKDEMETKMVQYNPLCSVCLRCNTSMQVLIAPAESKTAMYYICKYLSKHPFEFQRVLALLHQAKLEQRQYGSKAADAGAPDRNAKLILQKVMHKQSCFIEVSTQQVAAHVMNFNSFFSSHQFEFVFIGKLLKQYHESLKNYQYIDENIEENIEENIDENIDEKNEENMQENIEEKQFKIYEDKAYENIEDLETLDTETETGHAISISKCDNYKNRGEALKNLCAYIYTAIIKDQKITKKQKKPKNEKDPGRKDSQRFPFAPNSKAAKCREQIIRSCSAIPRVDRRPPAYPGKRPTDKKSKDYHTWNKKAKYFVEYYSLLFLPLDKNGFPFEPTQTNIKILPWQDKRFDSWENFWTIFGSWNVQITNNPTEKLYKRTIWKIFTNMVWNLRQGDGDRRLLRDWRARCAAIRPFHVPTDPNERKYDNVDRENDICAIEATLKNEYESKGVKPKDVQKKIAHKNKIMEFVKQQRNKLENLDKYDNHKVQTESFTDYKFKTVDKIFKDMKKACKTNVNNDVTLFSPTKPSTNFDVNTANVCAFSFLRYYTSLD